MEVGNREESRKKTFKDGVLRCCRHMERNVVKWMIRGMCMTERKGGRGKGRPRVKWKDRVR